MERPQDMADASVLAAQEEAWRAWLAEGIWQELPEISAPVLILQDEQDQLVSAENARRLGARIPGAQLELVPQAGHGLLMQEPRHCAERICRFLREQQPSRGV
jgi:pimeloyl-ACP methyl ester carboxylesterase